MNEILNMLHGRRTVRDFKPDQIDEASLGLILEAGHQAPSAWNGQPWHFTVVQKKSLLDRIVDVARDAMAEINPGQVNAMPWLVAPGFHYFYNAPTVIFVSGDKSSPTAYGDCAIAAMNMLYAAESLGIQTCVVVTALVAFETDHASEFINDLELPDGYEPMYALVLGYTSKPLPPAAPRKDNFVNFIR